MGSSLNLVVGGSPRLWAVFFGVACVIAQMFLDYRRYITKLKWLTLSLFAYFGVVLIINLPWHEVVVGLFLPQFHADPQYLAAIVAVFGTTISPYLFFWQSTQEVEEIIANPDAQALLLTPEHAARENKRIRFDTLVGMGFSNLTGLFIILTTAATLHAHGITDIQTSSQAAEALRPIAGDLAFFVFALGIVGTGLLAVPILAASSAYALGEALEWPIGLSRQPREAKAFYGTLAGATLIGAAINFTNIDPIKALYWAAIVNGVVAVPLMIVMMHMSTSPKIMGPLIIPRNLRYMGWLSTGVMAVIVIALFITSFS